MSTETGYVMVVLTCDHLTKQGRDNALARVAGDRKMWEPADGHIETIHTIHGKKVSEIAEAIGYCKIEGRYCHFIEHGTALLACAFNINLDDYHDGGDFCYHTKQYLKNYLSDEDQTS
jgi:hypothetical protein